VPVRPADNVLTFREQWMPYENQLIGAFVYALGYEGGRRQAGPMSVNLWQQTPLDAVFNDLIVGADTCLIIEFKRTSKALKTERGKWPAPALDRLLAVPGVQRFCEAAHFVVYGATAADGVDLRQCGYWDALMIGREPAANLDRGPARVLINALYDRNLGVRPDLLEWYLAKLRQARRPYDDTRSANGAGWLAVARHGGTYRLLSAGSLSQLLTGDRAQQAPVRSRTREKDRGDIER
jgi:hypothetical protein